MKVVDRLYAVAHGGTDAAAPVIARDADSLTEPILWLRALHEPDPKKRDAYTRALHRKWRSEP